MLRRIDDLPEHVLGIEATGEVTAGDYRDVLVPEVEALLARQPKARLLYVLGPDFKGFSGGATWADTKLGMRHFTDFERVAVVTDADWIERLVQAFGFVIPGDIRTFNYDDLEAARAWIGTARSRGELEFDLDEGAGVLVLRPRDELEVGDFERVEAAIDPYIRKAGGLNGLVVVAEEFPGWDSFAAMTSHFRFVREHHDKVRRVALVTSSRFLSALPRIAGRFTDAEVRRFELDDYERALAWVGGL